MAVKQDTRLLSLGPWQHGMDTIDDNIFISDQTVQSAVNLLFDDFGVPYPRPGVTKLFHGNAVYGASSAVFYILGIYRDYTTTSKVYVAVQVINSVGNQIFYVGLDGTHKAIGTVTGLVTFANSYQFSRLLKYNNVSYLVPIADGLSVGQKTTNPTSGSPTYTAVAAMPRGDTAFLLRDRMFVIDKKASRVYYSKATDPETWAAPDGGFFDVSPNDGEPIRTVVINNDVVYIFKLTRTWAFGFSADPGSDGTLRLLNQNEGAIESCEYNGIVYLLTRNGIFQFTNGQYTDIGRPILTRLDYNEGYNGTGIFAIGHYLYVYLGSDLTTIWAMNIYTKAWSVLNFDTAGAAGNPYSTIFGKPVNLEGTPFVIGSSGGVLWLANYDGSATYDTTSANVVQSPHYYFKSKRHVVNTYEMMKHFQYMMLFSKINLDAKDSAPVLIVHLESANTDNAQVVNLSRTPKEFNRPQTVGARFSAVSMELNKPLAAALAGATINTAGQPVGVIDPDFQIKQFNIFYELTPSHMTVSE